MKILAWNCRGIGGTFTVSQLKESIRLHNPDKMFLCETKQIADVMRKVGKLLKCEDRWVVKELSGRRGGLFVAWDQMVEVKQIWTNEFCIEIKISSYEKDFDFLIILIYASSTDLRERRDQLEFLKNRKQHWGSHWVLGVT